MSKKYSRLVLIEPSLLLAEAKPGRMSASIIKDLGEHPEDKKPVSVL